MDKRCKNCNRFKRRGYTQFGDCEIIFEDGQNPPDAIKRIIHASAGHFPFEKSQVYVGEDFGCHFFTEKKEESEKA